MCEVHLIWVKKTLKEQIFESESQRIYGFPNKKQTCHGFFLLEFHQVCVVDGLNA